MADTTRSRSQAKATPAVRRPGRSAVVGRGTDSPSSWGFGDGQAIPWEYAPAPESRDVVSIKPRYPLFIGGKDVAATGGRTFTTVDPATEEPLAEIARADATDVDKAVAAARRAFRSWGSLAGAERAKYLFRIARILQERAREFAVLETLDGGKPIKESRDVDVPLAAAHFWYYSGWADKLEYAFPNRQPRPLGVAAQVIPWNFPLLMLAWKIAPALAAGNTVVLKPASATPLSALLFADVCRQADLPSGVVNIITGPGEIGLALVSHPDVDKVAFTGSTAVGREIGRAVAGTHKGLTLELGGKAANIVFDDAPIDQAIEGVVNGIFFNQGEVCCAGSRLLVQESIADAFVDRLKERLSTLRVGDPMDKNTDVGAINNPAQLARIEELIEAGVAEGAELYQPACDLPARGWFVRPTLFTNVSQSMRIAREEIFGPVLSVITFRTPEEAIEKANNTPYGLSAGVWTEKGSRILAMVSRLRAGVVWANTFNRFDPTSPFGGYKESGFGREGGVHGLLPYLDLG
ncbi:MAG: aldehyde dehydrogenase family protein [Chloroflexota bacterium]